MGLTAGIPRKPLGLNLRNFLSLMQNRAQPWSNAASTAPRWPRKSTAPARYFGYSDDQAKTWSTCAKINDDTGTNSQFLPRIAVDQATGKIAISWYDCRNDPPNTSSQFYATISTDGGTTFWPNFRVSGRLKSNARSTYPSGGGIDYGDYSDIAFQNGVFFSIWADNSNSTGDNPPEGTLNKFDIYTRKVIVP